MKSAAILGLIPSIKRRASRSVDRRSDVADAALRARRPGVLARHRMTCAACRYVAREPAHLDVHHLDDDHQNNDEANLAAACHTCHPYQHIGEIAARADAFAEGLGKSTALAHVPELSAADLNLLQRAVAAAMLDESTRADAQAIHEELASRADVTECIFGTFKAADFAAAMARLTDEQYDQRARVLRDQRLVFSPKALAVIGREFCKDYPTLPVASWSHVAHAATDGAVGAVTDPGKGRP